MPYDRRHVLAQWGGTLPGGEIWSNSIRLAGSDTGANAHVPDQDQIVEWLEGPAKDAVAAFHARADSGIHAVAKLTFLKLNVVDMNGHYIEQTTHEYVYSPVVDGGSTATMHPNQCTLVVSTTTAFERGHAHRGRFYLPLCAMAPQSTTGQLAPSQALAVAVSAATFLSALHDQPGLDVPGSTEDVTVCVMSKIGAGATNRITGVEVGTVIDTQRRRRNALVESYQRAPLP